MFFSAREASDRVIASLEYLYSKKAMQIINLIPNTGCLFDEEVFKFLMRNLLINAIKYGYNHSIITINVKQDDPNYLEFIVQNKGDLLSEKKIKAILNFDKPLNSQGNGLGLLLCNYCLQLYKGYLKAESIDGKGNIFSFLIPKV